jgi:hypothetical protein
MQKCCKCHKHGSTMNKTHTCPKPKKYITQILKNLKQGTVTRGNA